MRILTLLGSPRPQGNTRAVLDAVLAGAREGGAEAELVELSELSDLSGCRECFACQEVPDAPGCAVEDDMQEILSKALTTDVLLLATPVFGWSMSWLLKAAVDRLYCMFKFGDDELRCLLEDRGMAGVVSAGGGENDGADLVSETFRRFARFSKSRWLGTFVAANVTAPDAIRADRRLCGRARAFGRSLVAKT
jgi:multimeric flavodoxin WrbA